MEGMILLNSGYFPFNSSSNLAFSILGSGLDSSLLDYGCFFSIGIGFDWALLGGYSGFLGGFLHFLPCSFTPAGLPISAFLFRESFFGGFFFYYFFTSSELIDAFGFIFEFLSSSSSVITFLCRNSSSIAPITKL
jgi:hypothetical protein